MPISKELLESLQAVPESDIDDASLKSLEGKPIYQQIFNRGHASSSGTSKQKVEDADRKVTEAQGRLTALQTEFDEHKKKSPDVATLDAQYKGQIEDLKKEIETLKGAAKNEKIEAKRKQLLARTREILKETINPVHAESLVDRDSVRSRISSEDGENGRILQPDKQIPYAGDDEAQAKALAAELAKDVPAIFRLTEIPKGTGNGATGGTGGTGSEKFQKIRDSVKKKTPAEGAVDPEVALKKRFGKSD